MNDDSLSVVFESIPYSEELQKAVERLISIASAGESRSCSGLSVILADDRLLKQLKRDYLDVDEPTDVLAFDVSDDQSDRIEGDIYISMDRVREQAEGDERAELYKLIVHGFLHLCGHDHHDNVSLERMIRLGDKYIQLFSIET